MALEASIGLDNAVTSYLLHIIVGIADKNLLKQAVVMLRYLAPDDVDV